MKVSSEVVPELDTLLGDPYLGLPLPEPPLSEGENLVPAAVREYGPLPAYEPVEPSRLLYYLHARSQIEVVGVSEDHLHTDLL